MPFPDRAALLWIFLVFNRLGTGKDIWQQPQSDVFASTEFVERRGYSAWRCDLIAHTSFVM
jgi:hypothetical protein